MDDSLIMNELVDSLLKKNEMEVLCRLDREGP